MALEIHPENLSHEGKALWGERTSRSQRHRRLESLGVQRGRDSRAGEGKGSCGQEHRGQVRGLK